MRLTPSLLRRTITAATLVYAGLACADAVTQPNESARGPRLDLLASDTSTIVAVDSLPAPRLLVCPTTDAASASAVIGPNGGTIGARGASITIPPGAVPDSTLFEVIVPAWTTPLIRMTLALPPNTRDKVRDFFRIGEVGSEIDTQARAAYEQRYHRPVAADEHELAEH